MTQLDSLRLALDALDKDMVSLFEKRMVISRSVAEYKKAHQLPVLDSEREQKVIQSRMDMLSDRSLSAPLEIFYQTLMALSREEQLKVLGKVASDA